MAAIIRNKWEVIRKGEHVSVDGKWFIDCVHLRVDTRRAKRNWRLFDMQQGEKNALVAENFRTLNEAKAFSQGLR